VEFVANSGKDKNNLKVYKQAYLILLLHHIHAKMHMNISCLKKTTLFRMELFSEKEQQF